MVGLTLSKIRSAAARPSGFALGLYAGLGLVLLVACGDAATPSPRAAPVPAQQSESTAPGPSTASENATHGESFGGAAYGFVVHASDNGRIVLIRRFLGDEPHLLGLTGASYAPNELVVFDVVLGTERIVDYPVEFASGRRFVLFFDDDRLWLLDANDGSWAALSDVEDDENPCLGPRGGHFSADGSRVAWLQNGSSSLRVRNLETGEEWDVSSEGRIWEGWPEDEGRGAVLLEVPAESTDRSRQPGSCAYPWCHRLATSPGMYGRGCPEFDAVSVADDGSRSAGVARQGSPPMPGETTAGCFLEAAENNGDRLERGPWHWVCGANGRR